MADSPSAGDELQVWAGAAAGEIRIAHNVG
jgi:hypothetical protein